MYNQRVTDPFCFPNHFPIHYHLSSFGRIPSFPLGWWPSIKIPVLECCIRVGKGIRDLPGKPHPDTKIIYTHRQIHTTASAPSVTTRFLRPRRSILRLFLLFSSRGCALFPSAYFLKSQKLRRFKSKTLGL